MSSWVDGAPVGFLPFETLNDSQAIGFAQGSLTYQIGRLANPFEAVGLANRIDRRGQVAEAAGVRQMNSSTHLGTWRIVDADDGVDVVWDPAEP